jgi:hypothetical protein
MLRILQQVFTAAFTGLYRQSTLITFLITVRVTIMNIGAPFWGVVFGSLFARLIGEGSFGVRALTPGTIPKSGQSRWTRAIGPRPKDPALGFPTDH